MRPKGIEDTEFQKIKAHSAPGEKNLSEQGDQANIKQNTTNQGYQQDR